VPDVILAKPQSLASEGPLRLKTEAPPENVDPSTAPPQRQTVLLAVYTHDSGTYRSSVGQTLVVTLDAPVKPGTYWLTPDNAVLLTYSAYSSPMRERVQLHGSIKVERITSSGVVAKVAVQQVVDVEATGFIEHPYDPAYQQFPFQISGGRTFEFTTPDDPSMGVAVKWSK
jgi:hypothetical protein